MSGTAYQVEIWPLCKITMFDKDNYEGSPKQWKQYLIDLTKA